MIEVSIRGTDKVFYYRGELIEETDEFLVLMDKKEGKVKVYKHSIIAQKESI